MLVVTLGLLVMAPRYWVSDELAQISVLVIILVGLRLAFKLRMFSRIAPHEILHP
jgi:hypothetical protein